MSTIPSSTTVTTTVVIGSAQYPSPLYVYGKVLPSAYGATGVYSDLAGATLSNSGTIAAGDGGSGSTTGGVAVDLRGSASTVTNYGYIDGGRGYVGGGSGGTGVSMAAGTLSNANSIIGGSAFGAGAVGGVGVAESNTTVNNNAFGFIEGGRGEGGASGGTGLSSHDSNVYNNVGSAIIGGSAVGSGGGSGGVGIELIGSGGATNFGYIGGGNSQSGNGGAGANVGTGTTLHNDVSIKGGAGNSEGAGSGHGGAGVELAAGGSLINYADGTITGGSAYGTGGVGVDLAGAAAMLVNNGEIYGGVGTGAFTGGAGVNVAAGSTVTNTGGIHGGTSLNGSGGVGVFLNGGTVTTSGGLFGGNNNDQYGSFADSVQFGDVLGGTLVVEAGAQFYGDLGGFKIGDTVDITNEAPPPPGTYPSDWNASTDTLTTANYGTLKFDGPFTDEHFVFTADGHGGMDISLAEGAACYLRGTHIRTVQGEEAIETLQIGDKVMTMSGVSRAIRWIGRRRYSGSFAAGNREVLPIRIRAGALGGGVPRRDLWVSPGHAMWLHGMLIPAQALTNGVSILQEETADEVTYIHLEFDTHDVIYAEGALSESFIDDESRDQFDNAAEYWALYPQASRTPQPLCAPRVEDGVELEALRQRLALRASARQSSTEKSSFAGPGSLNRGAARAAQSEPQKAHDGDALELLPDVFAALDNAAPA